MARCDNPTSNDSYAFSDDKNGQLKSHERLGVLAYNQERADKATRHFKAALSSVSVVCSRMPM